jgi:hypothetical protein
MSSFTRRVAKQLSAINPLEKQTKHLRIIERSHIAGALVVTALVETTFEIAAGLLLDGLHVISREQSISSDTTEEDPEQIYWRHES